jgi:tetratricopeptide (TPR) repeat protein
MNKAELNILSGQPEMLDKARLNDMKAIVKDFPYFQGARVLLLKNLNNINHYEYDATLKKVSLCIPDRIHLYHFIYEILQDEAPVYKKRSVNEIGVDTDKLNTKTTTDPNSEESVRDEVPEIKPNNLDETIKPEEVSENVANIITEKHLETQVPTEQIEVLLEEVKLPTAEPKLLPDNIDQKTNEVHSFTEWLKLSKGIIQLAEETVQPLSELNATKELDSETLNTVAQIIKNSDETANPIKIETAVKESNVVVLESILDKFLRENPRMSRQKAEFYNPSNMAKQSVEEDDEIATETLAKIYLKQGHYKKAIRIYEKLCLIYPHRITYFADLIQIIKQDNKD